MLVWSTEVWSTKVLKYGDVSDEEMEAYNAKQNEQCVTNTYATVMHDLDGSNIDPKEIVNIDPAEGQQATKFGGNDGAVTLSFPWGFIKVNDLSLPPITLKIFFVRFSFSPFCLK